MGCCCAKEAAIATPPNDEDVTPNDSATSPATNISKSDPNPVPAATKQSRRSRAADSSVSAPEITRQQAAPPAPSGAIPISKGERPPPGWGGTPEVEDEVEVELDESKNGPRALQTIPGGNGYISGTRKDQEISEGVMDRIKGLEDAGLQVTKKMGLKMLTPRIITDVKESWDREGNITRYMTHYIEEPDGRKHTKKETLYIAAGDPDPMAPEPVAESE